MNTITSIAVGIDFTSGSAAALQEALRIAEWNRAPVRAVHVIDPLVAAELQVDLSRSEQDPRGHLIADARQAWTAFAAEIPGAAAVPIDVRIDHCVRGILAAATEAKADLLVIGAFGAHEPEVGIGTVATACVRHASTGVLVVRDTQPGPFTSIVACVDFSPTSVLALHHAARVATQDGAALHLLHVFEAPWRQLHYRAPTPQADPRFQKQYKDALERRLQAVAKELGAELDYLKPTFALFEYQGYRSGIVEYARKVGADLIVLGTRGRTNIRDVLLGSTAEKVLRDSTCSVLAIRPVPSTHSMTDQEVEVPISQMRPPG